MARTICFKCMTPGSIPGCIKSILASGVVVNYSTREEKGLSGIKKNIKKDCSCRGDGLVVRTKCCKVRFLGYKLE